jgi:ATP-dependent exoDNAse (exonuclease V) alpha subunit
MCIKTTVTPSRCHRAGRELFFPAGKKTKGGYYLPNYHLSIKIFSRGKAASAVEKAAYRAGEKLVSDYTGEVFDYTRKGGVTHTEILLPDHAPREYADRSTLWNAVENSEKNENAQLAREIEFSLPRELTIEQNIILAREFVQKHFADKGMCADICVHDKGDGNPHAHVMLTMRPFNEDGTWGAKSRKEYILDANGERIRLPSGEYKSRKVNAMDWNERTKAEEWRVAWEDTANAALASHGIEGRIDHRSYKRQGIDNEPTVHLGPAASQMERKGIRTERGDINRCQRQ